MLTFQLCHKFINNLKLDIHKRRLASLSAAVDSVVSGGMLTVSSIGRNMSGQAKVKHKIKRADRLLSNNLLYSDRENIYKATCEMMLGAPERIILLVDWSPFQHKRTEGILRASCAFHGRSITVYEEVYQYKKVMQIKTQGNFLDKVKRILPKSSHVIVTTDMGFNHPWFNHVLSLGWDFVGRLSSIVKYTMPGGEWEKTVQLGSQATTTAKIYPSILIYKSHSLKANIVTKRKTKKELKNEYSKNPTVKQYQVQASRSWVLVTSLKWPARTIAKIYSKRMQIETGFRDCKSYRFGLGLILSFQSAANIVRKSVFLIIAHLALCLLMLIGFMGEQRQWHYAFQANSIKRKRILSYTFLGKQIVKHYISKIRSKDIADALLKLRSSIDNIIPFFEICGDP